MTNVIDGRQAASALRARVEQAVKRLSFRPSLAVILVGNDPASAVYVRTKDRAAKAAGLAVQTVRLPVEATQSAVIAAVERLNADDDVDGILVQLPLPRQLDARSVLATLNPAKDVDGLTLANVGGLAEGRPVLSLERLDGETHAPCTPLAVMRLLASVRPSLAGARAVVLGRSALVGRPVAAMLTAADATVTVLHSRSAEPAEECRRADVVVAAIGRPETVRGSWIKPGAVVIDVGINRTEGGLVGDVAFAEAAKVASAITPVPGGVGPMTVACLLENTVAAAIVRRGRRENSESARD